MIRPGNVAHSLKHQKFKLTEPQHSYSLLPIPRMRVAFSDGLETPNSLIRWRVIVILTTHNCIVSRQNGDRNYTIHLVCQTIIFVNILNLASSSEYS